MQLVQVPTKHGKADLTIYRNAGSRVLEILSRADVTVERASIDECYLDLTDEAARRLADFGGAPTMPSQPEKVHVYGIDGQDVPAKVWFSRDILEWGPGEAFLAAGAALVAEMRAVVDVELGYTCSAGIAHTRLLAKLCSGLHKPAQQTVLPACSVEAMLAPLPLSKLRGLGGAFGIRVATEMGVGSVGEVVALPISRLQTAFGEKDGLWLYNLVRGVDGAEVEERKLPKSVSCGKTFRGQNALKDLESVHKWLGELAQELEERLTADKEENARVPQLLTVSIGSRISSHNSDRPEDFNAGVSRSCSLHRLQAVTMAGDALALVKNWTGQQSTGWIITSLFMGASNFVPAQTTAITHFFKPLAGGTDGMPNNAINEGGAPGTNCEVLEVIETEGPVSRGEEGPSTSGTPAARPRNETSGFDGMIDESVLAELPLDIQKEVRAQLKLEAMAARMQSRCAPNRQDAGADRSSAKRPDAGQQTLIECLKGKRKKR